MSFEGSKKTGDYGEKGYLTSGVSDKDGLPEICQKDGRRTDDRCHRARYDQVWQLQCRLRWGKRAYWTRHSSFYANVCGLLWQCYLCDLGGQKSLSQPRFLKGLIDDNLHSWQPSTCAQSLLMVPCRGPIRSNLVSSCANLGTSMATQQLATKSRGVGTVWSRKVH